MGMQGPYQPQIRTQLPITPNQSGLTILMADPDVASAEQLAAALHPRHLVTVVGSGRAALAAIMLSVPQMIVTELDLPDAEGLELVACWHTDPPTQHTLLMIVTCRRSARDKIAGLQAGADMHAASHYIKSGSSWSGELTLRTGYSPTDARTNRLIG